MARVNIIEWIAKKLKSLTGIVEDGDTAAHAISAGKYVIWKGDPCKASSAISIGDALSSSNLTALTDGVCNDLADETGAKVNKTDIVDNLTTNDPTKVLSAAQGYALNSKIANPLNIQFSNITGTSQSTFESSLNTALNGMNTGDVRCCSAYANYSQSLTNGGQSIAFLYKQTASVWWCFLVMSGSTKVGYYMNSVWTWL